MAEQFLLIETDTTVEVDGEKSGRDTIRGFEPPSVEGRVSRTARKISVLELQEKMASFLETVELLFAQTEAQRLAQQQKVNAKSRMQLDEISLVVEMTAEGEFKLVAGGKIGGKGSITLKFKRVDVE